MAGESVSQPITRWSSARRFVPPVWVERLIGALLAATLAAAGVGIALIPGVVPWLALPVAILGGIGAVLLLRAVERTIAASVIRVELGADVLTLVRWGGDRADIPIDRIVASELGQWRSPSRPGIPHASRTLTIAWRSAAHADTSCQLIGAWRPSLDEIQGRLAALRRASGSDGLPSGGTAFP